MTNAMSNTMWIAIGSLYCVLFVIAFPRFPTPPANPPAPTRTITYDSRRICDNAYEQSLDFSHSPENHITIQLPGGCFGGWVKLPFWWTDWHSDATGENQDQYWVAFWYENQRLAQGPFPANSHVSLNHGLHELFRLQGHGTAIFYTNQPSKATVKPDSKGIYNVGGDVQAPVITRRQEPEYTPEARAAHWSGDIRIKAVVDDDGHPADIVFLDPAPYGLDAKILEALHTWKFQPATLNGEYVNAYANFTFTFREY